MLIPLDSAVVPFLEYNHEEANTSANCPNTTLLRLLRAMDLSGRMGLKATGSVTEQEALLDREPVIGTILRTKAH
jgi:hypothetical protein